MILVEKDRHLKKSEPFFSAHKAYNKWICEQYWSTKNTAYISLGDWYNVAVPSPEEVDETERFFNEFLGEIYILAGNHDFSTSDKVYSILPLRNNPRVKIITEPKVISMDGVSFAFLPFMKNVKYMKEAYENLSDEFINAENVLYHFDDKSVSNKGIDISYLKGRKIGGHEHLVSDNYFLGMPINSCYTEKGQKNNILGIDSQHHYNIIDVPTFVDYYDVEYGQDLPTVEAQFPIWNIINAPSKKQGEFYYRDKYPTIEIHEVKVLNKKQKKIENKEKSNSITDFFDTYTNNRTDLKSWTIIRLRSIIEK